MAEPFMPSSDSEALEKMQNMVAYFAANVGTYFLSSADVVNMQGVVTSFANANAVATTPATRTPGAVNDKNVARNIAEQLLRQYSIQIKFNAGISDTAKIHVGINPPNPNRQPVNVPGTSPIGSVIAATPGCHTYRYADSMTPASRAKPFGARAIEIFVAIDEGPVENADVAKFYGAFTKNPVPVVFNQIDSGKMATYFARWAGKDGEVGPWSLPVSMRIAA